MLIESSQLRFFLINLIRFASGSLCTKLLNFDALCFNDLIFDALVVSVMMFPDMVSQSLNPLVTTPWTVATSACLALFFEGFYFLLYGRNIIHSLFCLEFCLCTYFGIQASTSILGAKKLAGFHMLLLVFYPVEQSTTRLTVIAFLFAMCSLMPLKVWLTFEDFTTLVALKRPYFDFC